jgi:hypothetical protein
MQQTGSQNSSQVSSPGRLRDDIPGARYCLNMSAFLRQGSKKELFARINGQHCKFREATSAAVQGSDGQGNMASNAEHRLMAIQKWYVKQMSDCETIIF